MCGESWLAIKDSLTHHPSSQGWASWCLLGLFFYAIFNFLCVMYICVALFVWVGITFLPLYSLASVLCTCISMYTWQCTFSPSDCRRLRYLALPGRNAQKTLQL